MSCLRFPSVAQKRERKQKSQDGKQQKLVKFTGWQSLTITHADERGFAPCGQALKQITQQVLGLWIGVSICEGELKLFDFLI